MAHSITSEFRLTQSQMVEAQLLGHFWLSLMQSVIVHNAHSARRGRAGGQGWHAAHRAVESAGPQTRLVHAGGGCRRHHAGHAWLPGRPPAVSAPGAHPCLHALLFESDRPGGMHCRLCIIYDQSMFSLASNFCMNSPMPSWSFCSGQRYSEFSTIFFDFRSPDPNIICVSA